MVKIKDAYAVPRFVYGVLINNCDTTKIKNPIATRLTIRAIF